MKVKWLFGVIVVFSVGLLSGCYKHEQPSGELVGPPRFFPQSVSAKMRDGDPEKLEPARMYRNDKAFDAKNHNKMILDPIVVFADPYRKGEGVTPEDAQTVVDYLFAKLVDNFEKSEHVAKAQNPGPQTLRLSIAIIALHGSDVATDTMSNPIPQVHLLSTVGAMQREKPFFKGDIGIAFKATESQTGELLAAGIDRRFGGKTWGKEIDDWADLKTIIDWYVDVTTWRACTFQNLPDCDRWKPSET